MKKVLSIFMAIAMFVTMFSFSTVAFAEENVEPAAKEVKNVYIGAAKNFVYAADKSRPPQLVEVESTPGSPWNFNVFNPETPVEGVSNKVNPPAFVGNVAIDKVNGYVASGEYSEVNINVTASTESSVLFKDLKGTAETPIVILTTAGEQNKTFKGAAAPAISLVDCEYVTIKNIAVSSQSNGIFVEGCSNVAIENVAFTNVGFVDYLSLQAVLDAEGKEVKDEEGNVMQENPKMDTTAIAERGSSVFVGANCDSVKVSACSFTDCRAGVVADSSKLEEGDKASTGVEVLDCTFTKMTDVAVYVNKTADVLVSGGSVTGSGILANASDYKAEVSVANFYAKDAQNITIEKVYSTDNKAFIDAENTTGRVRYNVSTRDGSSSVAAAELKIYNNTFTEAVSQDFNAVVENNIFWMVIGEKVAVENGKNNCYYWTSKGDRASIRKNPQFAFAYTPTDEGKSVKDNYILAVGSPCLGAGEKVEEDMGSKDFYGNDIGESINIGADAFGAGTATELTFASDFVDFFNYIIAVISNFFANLFA